MDFIDLIVQYGLEEHAPTLPQSIPIVSQKKETQEA